MKPQAERLFDKVMAITPPHYSGVDQSHDVAVYLPDGRLIWHTHETPIEALATYLRLVDEALSGKS